MELGPEHGRLVDLGDDEAVADHDGDVGKELEEEELAPEGVDPVTCYTWSYIRLPLYYMYSTSYILSPLPVVDGVPPQVARHHPPARHGVRVVLYLELEELREREGRQI